MMFTRFSLTNFTKSQNVVQMNHNAQNKNSSILWMKSPSSHNNAFQSFLPSIRTLITVEKIPWNWRKGVFPVQSKKPFEIHYNNIYKKYVRTANALMRGTRWELYELEHAVYVVGKSREEPALYNNLSAAWNHLFFFHCIHPDGVPPSRDMQDLIDLHFGSMVGLQKQIYHVAKALPAGGWIWLTEKDGHLSIQNTFLNGSPLFEFGEGHRILFGLDCWEHAYFHDFLDDLEAYVAAFVHGINWSFVEINLLSKPAQYLSDDSSKWEAPENEGEYNEERDIHARLEKWRENQRKLGLYEEEKEEEEGEEEGDVETPQDVPQTTKEALLG